MSESRRNAKKLLKLFGPKGEHWTKKTFARTRNGREIEPESEHAVRWCLRGACYVLGIETAFLVRSLKSGLISNFNDADGFAPVKKLLQKIARGK